MAKIAEPAPLQEFDVEGAVEAFVLALGLRMAWTPMQEIHAQAQQPHSETGIGRLTPGAAPG